SYQRDAEEKSQIVIQCFLCIELPPWFAICIFCSFYLFAFSPFIVTLPVKILKIRTLTG
ncbi:hypothetical protein HMPREF9151_02061, partial [Hoylesella saccharolytica F0055]